MQQVTSKLYVPMWLLYIWKRPHLSEDHDFHFEWKVCNNLLSQWHHCPIPPTMDLNLSFAFAALWNVCVKLHILQLGRTVKSSRAIGHVNWSEEGTDVSGTVYDCPRRFYRVTSPRKLQTIWQKNDVIMPVSIWGVYDCHGTDWARQILIVPLTCLCAGHRPASDVQWPRIVRTPLVRRKHTVCRMCVAAGKLEEVVFTASKHGK